MHAFQQVDVFIPVYNDVEFIQETIQSCLKQREVDVRVLVSDNQSTDGSFEKVSEMASLDDRIVVSRNPENLGFVGNLQRLHYIVERPYYMFLCSDDCLRDDYAFKDALLLFEQHPEITSVYSNIDFIDAKGAKIASNKFRRGETFDARETLSESLISMRNRFGIPLLHRTDISRQYPYRSDLKYTNDLWHSYKVGSHGRCGHIERECIGNRYTGNNLTIALMSNAISEFASIAESENIDLSRRQRLFQRINHCKVIAAKIFFFQVLLPLRKMLGRS